FVNAGFILVASYFLFGVEVKGSLILLFLTTLIFLFAATSLGIFISAVANSQQVAFTFATFLSLLPSLILSGFIFPIDNMPFLIQIIPYFIRTKFFLVILREFVLNGLGVEVFYELFIYMILFVSVLLLLGTFINKKKASAS